MKLFKFSIFFILIFLIITDDEYIKGRIEPYEHINLIPSNKKNIIALSLKNFKKNTNINLLLRTKSEFEINNIKYGYYDINYDDIGIPKETFNINLNYNSTLNDKKYYYFNINIGEHKQVSFLIDNVPIESIFANTKFNEANFKIYNYTDNIIINLKKEPVLFAVKTTEYNNFYSLDLSSNDLKLKYSEILYYSSLNDLSNFISFPSLESLLFKMINLNGKKNIYSNIEQEGVKIIYFAIISNSIDQITIKINTKPYLIYAVLDNKLELNITSNITLISNKIEKTDNHYYYFFKHHKGIKINKIYYSLSEKEKENLTEFNITELNCKNKENQNKNEYYYYCNMKKKENIKTFNLILFSEIEKETTNITFKKRNYDESKYDNATICKPIKISNFESYEPKLIAFGDIEKEKSLFLKLTHKSNKIEQQYYLIHNNIDNIFEIPDDKIILNELFKLKIDDNEILYFDYILNNINSNLLSIISIFNFNGTLEIERTKNNEFNATNKGNIKKYDAGKGKFEKKNFYLLLNISEFHNKEEIFMKFNISSKLINDDVYYSITNETNDNFNISYKNSSCKNKIENNHIIYYCNYIKLNNNDKSIKFILFGYENDIIYYKNTEINEFETKNNQKSFFWIYLIIILVIILIIIIFFLIKKNKKEKSFDIQPFTKI